ncbi:TPA: fimbrial biogenesis chaperone [Photobacterium damselae]|uniref:Molecular chaperone n=1 Tax=Photobacterium damselae subsp. damselae TaxID=85581 RepID=A0AAD3WXB6_PHODD|nr:molecular chaperone [Photobacterium damselae]KAB1182342.1 molecular chaperone [Photobacterium damselae subsp. damselae]
MLLVRSFLIIFSLLFSCMIYAGGLQINKTRIIMLEDQKSTSVKITNKGDLVYGAQTWIDKVTGNEDIMTFPSLFTVSKSQPQSLKIVRLDGDSETKMNQEELYWLNLQEIPPKSDSDSDSNSTLQLAVRTKIKLIIRPESIKSDRDDAEKKLIVKADGKNISFENPTPFYIFAYKISNNKKSLINKKLNIIEPYGKVIIRKDFNVKANDNIMLYHINDYGAEVKTKLKVH